MAIEKSLKAIHEMMTEMLQDTSIPKNIRKAISEAKQRIEGEDELSVKISASIYLIESVSNDINIPPHARTQLWAIMGALESVKK